MTPPNDNNDWDAFRYLYGEMTPEELEHWDDRVLDDGDALRSLERAIHLAGALEQVFAERSAAQRVVRSRIPAVFRSLAWLIPAVAAAILLLLHLVFSPHPVRSPGNPIGGARGVPELPHLAEVWLNTYRSAGLSGVSPDLEATDHRGAVNGDESLDAEPLEPLVEAPGAAPSWMMLAVAELHIKGETDDVLEGRP